MQSVDNSGVLGALKEFDAKELAKMLQNPEIDHVDVFEGTPENLKKRKKMVGKKYKLKPAYQKVPKIKRKRV
ncbi:MAG: hypothetical protein KAS32_13000 [Candidatus Peribacteraceae bacterium]|nr:hypothetical protein [Candidatus Peribacteraceae bacterium]